MDTIWQMSVPLAASTLMLWLPFTAFLAAARMIYDSDDLYGSEQVKVVFEAYKR